MILQTKENLEDFIVKTLADKPSLTVAQINKELVRNAKKYTPQAIYKELRKLQKEGVLFKLGNQYTLRLPWVFDFVSLADKLSTTYTERPQLSLILPEINKKEIWHFSDLLKMNDFWSHILLILIQQVSLKFLSFIDVEKVEW